MLARCRWCREQIRDCTAFRRMVPVISWYHITHGYERCRGGMTMAEPPPRVHVACRFHPRSYDELCRYCDTAAQVSLHFHNDGRCIPLLCGWPHVHPGS